MFSIEYVVESVINNPDCLSKQHLIEIFKLSIVVESRRAVKGGECREIKGKMFTQQEGPTVFYTLGNLIISQASRQSGSTV